MAFASNNNNPLRRNALAGLHGVLTGVSPTATPYTPDEHALAEQQDANTLQQRQAAWTAQGQMAGGPYIPSPTAERDKFAGMAGPAWTKFFDIYHQNELMAKNRGFNTKYGPTTDATTEILGPDTTTAARQSQPGSVVHDFASSGQAQGLKSAIGGQNAPGMDANTPSNPNDRWGAGVPQGFRNASVADLIKYGYLNNPDDVAARSTILQRQAQDPGDPVTGELKQEDILGRRAEALQGFKEQLLPRKQTVADIESEGQNRRTFGLPWAEYGRQEIGRQKMEQLLNPIEAKTAGDMTIEGAKLGSAERIAEANRQVEIKKGTMAALARSVSGQYSQLTPEQQASTNSQFGQMTGAETYTPEIESSIKTAMAAVPGTTRADVVANLKARGIIR